MAAKIHQPFALKAFAAFASACLVISALACAGCSNNAGDQGSSADQAASEAPKLIQEGKLTIASDFAFPPFEYVENGKKAGFSVELMDAVGKKAGLEINWTDPMKFDTLVPQVAQHTKIDAAVASITITPDREKEIAFSDPYLDSNQALTVLKDSGYTSEADLNVTGKQIAVQSGTSGEAWAFENLPNATVVPFEETTAAFSALQAKQADAVVVDLPVTAWLVKNSYPDCEIIAEIPTGEQYGIALTKDNVALQALLNKALEEVKADGTYQQIYDKYFGVSH